MHFAHVIHSRKGLAWVFLVALVIVAVLIAAFVLWSGKSQGPFDMDKLYGLLD